MKTFFALLTLGFVIWALFFLAADHISYVDTTTEMIGCYTNRCVTVNDGPTFMIK